MRNDKPYILTQISETKAILLPTFECFQEEINNHLGIQKKLRVYADPQVDGSRIKFFKFTKALPTIHHWKVKINETYPNVKIICAELIQSPFKPIRDFYYEKLRNQKVEYISVLTNVFENGRRYFPIIINHTTQVAYNVSPVFRNEAPNEYGVFIVDRNVNHPELGSPREISYLAAKRMCPMCLRVGDHSKEVLLDWSNNYSRYKKFITKKKQARQQKLSEKQVRNILD